MKDVTETLVTPACALVATGAAFGGSVKEEIHPGAGFTGQDLRREILNRATSVYHGVGTCRMGVDERAVVDPQLKVNGLESLRVVDASIIPDVPSGFTHFPTVMLAERLSERIAGML